MAITTFARSEEANVVLLEEKLKRDAFYQLFFAPFLGQTTEDKIDGSRVPSGAPIELLEAFAEEGGDSMLLPMLGRLSGVGVSGDAQLKGNEEAFALYYQKVYINQKRHGVKLGGRMSNQRVKKFDLMRKAEPLLADWLAQWIEYDILYTFYHGYSSHVLGSAAGELNLTSGQKICHPNFYAAGSGFVTWNATASTYEGNVEDAVTGVTDTSTDYMSADLLEELRVACMEKKIAPIQTEYGEYIPILLHPKQAKQLRKDSDYRNAMKDALRMDFKNPIFKGAMAPYAGFLPFERMMVMGVEPNAGAGTVSFGSANPLSSLDTYARKAAIIFGKGAIATGMPLGPYYDPDDEDYKNMRGAGMGVIIGSARAEFKDNSTDGSNTLVKNTSSMIVVTYSD